MPPKKRKGAASAAAAVEAEIQTPTRPKRGGAMPPPDQPASKKVKTATGGDATRKKAGRPAKAKAEEDTDDDNAAEESMELEPVQPRRRAGRPSNSKAEEVVEDTAEDAAEEPEAALPKKRGRPAKAKAEDVTEEPEPLQPKSKAGRPAKATAEELAEDAAEESETVQPKKRVGRPAKAKPEEAIDNAEDTEPAQPKRKLGRPARARPEEAIDNAEDTELMQPKKRGRPAKAKAEEIPEDGAEEHEPVQPKNRGRPAKVKAEEVIEDAAEELMQPETVEPKKVGRPTKAAAAAKATAAGNTTTKKNERETRPRTSRRTSDLAPEYGVDDLPRRKTQQSAIGPACNADGDVDEPEETAKESYDEPKKRGRLAKGRDTRAAKVEVPKEKAITSSAPRGRPSKATKEVEDAADANAETPVKRGRGRPSKANVELNAKLDEDETPHRAHTHFQHVESEKQLMDELEEAVEDEPKSASSKKPDGKRKSTAAPRSGAKRAKKAAAIAEEAADIDDSNEANATEATTVIANDVGGDDSGRHYWLMKAEPESRIEKNKAGVECDVKFTIDELRAKAEPEGWEGIRNAEAQKNLRAMNVGDLAFFYESNTKKPGIVGIMEIVESASPDHSAFDTQAPYYDPKSDPNKPKWMLVHVKFVRKFAEKVTLKELQSYSKTNGVLEGMDLLNRGRLSVGKVSQAQWKFIMGLVGDADDVAVEHAVDGVIDEDGDDDDRSNDFASAFEAPVNLGVTKAEHSDDAPAAQAEEQTEENGILPTSDTRMGEAAEAVSSIFGSVETVIGTAADTIAETASTLMSGVKAPSLASSKKPSRAGSRAPSARPRSRAGSLAPSVRSTTSRARSTVRESIKEVADVFMHQSDTILEETDGADGEAEDGAHIPW
ncbi:hypothetical protein MBLNU459_g4096t1 [Dothideomycetes sp. NU459]